MLVLSTILNPSFFSKVSEVFCTYVRARALKQLLKTRQLFISRGSYNGLRPSLEPHPGGNRSRGSMEQVDTGVQVEGL